MRCPVCRADNGLEETTCRRCRADLSLLAELEQARQGALHNAARAAAAGDGCATLYHARVAHALRPGPETWRCLALGFLLMHDFEQALVHHQRYRSAR